MAASRWLIVGATTRLLPTILPQRFSTTTTSPSILGNRYRKSVRDRIEVITARPESFGRIHEKFRAATVDRFPYVVLFEYDDGTTTILGVFHAASDREGDAQSKTQLDCWFDDLFDLPAEFRIAPNAH